MSLYIINFFHVLASLLLVNYPLLIYKNSFYDYIYIILLFLLLYSYVILKGECFVSYAIKKYRDPNYIAGSNLSVVNEYASIFNSEEVANYIIIYILLTFIITSFIVLNRHNFINIHYIYIFTLVLVIYFILLKIKGLSKYSFYFNIFFMIYITFLFYRFLIHQSSNVERKSI